MSWELPDPVRDEDFNVSAPSERSFTGKVMSHAHGAETISLYCKGDRVQARRWGKTHALCRCGALVRVVA